MEGADCAFGQRSLDNGCDCDSGGQERAHGPASASPLHGQGGGRVAEGRNPPIAREAADA